MSKYQDKRIQLNNRLVPVLTGILFILYWIDPYKGWMVLFVGIGGLWGISFIWARTLAKGLKFSREKRFGWAQVGDRLEERFTIENEGLLPALWVEVIYQSDMPDYQPGRVVGVEKLSRSQWRTEGVCTRRGMFTLGPVTLRSGDPFGIYIVTHQFSTKTTILVTPPIINLPEIEVVPGGRAGERKARRSAFQRSVNTAGVREYHSGDSLRHIHWLTTARRSSFYVRVFEQSQASDWWVFLDLDRAAQKGKGFYSTEEHAVILAASITDWGIRQGNAVGLAVNGGNVVWSPPSFGEEHRHEIMRALALATPGKLPINFLLSQVPSLIHRNPSLILITSNMYRIWLEDLFPLIELGMAPTILLLDPNTYDLSYSSEEHRDKLDNVEIISRLKEIEGVRGTARLMMETLSANGIVHYRFTRTDFDLPEARPGKWGHWQWSKSKSSRAMLDKAPGELNWKEVR